jgi:hypothetical protein
LLVQKKNIYGPPASNKFFPAHLFRKATIEEYMIKIFNFSKTKSTTKPVSILIIPPLTIVACVGNFANYNLHLKIPAFGGT